MVSFEQMTVAQLKERLTARGLSKVGKKAELIARLRSKSPAKKAQDKMVLVVLKKTPGRPRKTPGKKGPGRPRKTPVKKSPAKKYRTFSSRKRAGSKLGKSSEALLRMIKKHEKEMWSAPRSKRSSSKKSSSKKSPAKKAVGRPRKSPAKKSPVKKTFAGSRGARAIKAMKSAATSRRGSPAKKTFAGSRAARALKTMKSARR